MRQYYIRLNLPDTDTFVTLLERVLGGAVGSVAIRGLSSLDAPAQARPETHEAPPPPPPPEPDAAHESEDWSASATDLDLDPEDAAPESENRGASSTGDDVDSGAGGVGSEADAIAETLSVEARIAEKTEENLRAASEIEQPSVNEYIDERVVTEDHPAPEAPTETAPQPTTSQGELPLANSTSSPQTKLTSPIPRPAAFRQLSDALLNVMSYIDAAGAYTTEDLTKLAAETGIADAQRAIDDLVSAHALIRHNDRYRMTNMFAREYSLEKKLLEQMQRDNKIQFDFAKAPQPQPPPSGRAARRVASLGNTHQQANDRRAELLSKLREGQDLHEGALLALIREAGYPDPRSVIRNFISTGRIRQSGTDRKGPPRYTVLSTDPSPSERWRAARRRLREGVEYSLDALRDILALCGYERDDTRIYQLVTEGKIKRIGPDRVMLVPLRAATS